MSQEINAGPLRFTATVSFNGSDEARRYAELNRAASEAKERSYDEAVELLRQAKALKGDMYEDSRLAKFLQTAGRFDEAMAEVHWLIDRASGASGKNQSRLHPVGHHGKARGGWYDRRSGESILGQAG